MRVLDQNAFEFSILDDLGCPGSVNTSLAISVAMGGCINR